MDPSSRQPFQQFDGDDGRSFVKCDYCRKRHKKCLWESGRWPEARCTDCEKANLPCGPAVHWKDSQLSNLDKETPASKRARRRASSVGQIALPVSPLPNSQGQPQHQHQPHNESLPNSSSPENTSPTPTHTPSSFNNGARKHGHLDLTKDDLVPRLIHIGDLCILYEELKGLEAASNPPLQTPRGHSISHNIEKLEWFTVREVKSGLKTIIDLIKVEDKPIELQALRYREALDTVAEINNLGSENEALVGLEVTILSKLILIYEQLEDLPTVRRFSLRRSSLHRGSSTVADPCYTAHTARSWAEACGKLPALLDSLDLQIHPLLLTNGRPFFPPRQSALRCGRSDLADALNNELGHAHQDLDMLKQTPLLAAAAAGKLSSLSKHLQDDQSFLRSRDLFHRTALFHTAYRGHLETFVSLVRAGADVLDRDEDNQSILCAACAAGNVDIVRWLLEYGGVSSPNDHFWGSRSPLHDAARAGHTNVCLVLLEKGAYVDYLIDGITPAQAARANGFGELADLLEGFLGKPANQYSSERLYDPSQVHLPTDLIQPPNHQPVNPYACPTPLRFEMGSVPFSNDMKGTPGVLHHPAMDPSPMDDQMDPEGAASEGSHNEHFLDPGRLFGH